MNLVCSTFGYQIKLAAGGVTVFGGEGTRQEIECLYSLGNDW
jgi:hypothetical protein